MVRRSQKASKRQFRMKKKPVKPSRAMGEARSKTIARGHGQIVATKLIKALEKLSKEESVPLSNIKYNYGTAYWTAPEPMEKYQERLKRWEENLKKWEEWAKDYSEEIKAYFKEKALKESKKTAARIKAIKKRQDQLDEDLITLQEKAQKEEQLLYELSK